MTFQQYRDDDCNAFPRVSETFSTRTLLKAAAIRYRKEMTDAWVKQYGNSVRWGPFAGLRLEQLASWGDGDMLAKFTGSYEGELHSVILDVIRSNYSVVINIGCAEGYYAVGFAREMQFTKVFAFDRSPVAQEVCKRTAVLNGVSERVTVLGECTISDLGALLFETDKTFLLVDCEGAEMALLSPSVLPQLEKTDILVECHDFIFPGTTDVLGQRFSNTHHVSRIDEDGRLFGEFPLLTQFSGIDRAVAICEWRPVRMNWLYCQAR